MNENYLEEFYAKYKNYGDRDKILIKCSCQKCTCMDKIFKSSALRNITKNGVYKCHCCCYTPESRAKIGRAASYKRSAVTKKKMSDARKKLFKTEEGQTLRRHLSRLSAIQQAKNNPKSYHRSGFIECKRLGKNLFYSSSYELRAIYLCDLNENIKDIEVQVPIETNNRNRCVDLICTRFNGSRLVIEVKPKLRLGEEAIKQQIQDIEAWSKQKGYDFQVWTEDDSGLGSYRQILAWAEKYIYEHTDVDVAAIRKKKSVERTQRYYQKHLKDDKITVDCEFCKCQHTIMRLAYEQNIENNGRYICPKENGHIVGKKPKPHLRKENPYAAEGRKLCKGPCGQVLAFDKFGPDRSRTDGLCTKCRECRKRKNGKK